MTERKITPPAEQQRFLLRTLEYRVNRLNKAEADHNPFLVKVAKRGISETYYDFTRMEIPDSTQPNGVRTVVNLDAERVANDIIKHYKDGFEEATMVPQAPIGSPVKTQSVDAEERLAKAALDGVDIVNSLNQPVRVTMDGNTVRYEIGEKALLEDSIEIEEIVPAQPNKVSRSTPMQEDYDWGVEEEWTIEVYPKIDPLGHSG